MVVKRGRTVRPTEDTVYIFEGFSLDLARGGLFSPAQAEIPLRPKAFALLRLFVENAGRLLDRDTILSVVWPKVLVTEDSITQCVREIRAALGHDGSHLIRAVRARGYVLSASVSQMRSSSWRAQRDNGDTTDRDDGSLEPEFHQCVPSGPLLPGLLSPAFEPPRLSIVVLPFANLSDDREQQFLADGITMDLTTDLSRIRESLVISCNTSFTYRNKPIETKQIARELDVRFVLEGSVQRSGNHVRVNAQLIDGVTDSHVWADRFDGDVGDLAALQDEVVSRIAGALDVELNFAEAARPHERLDVLECIFRGHALRRQTLSRDIYERRIEWYEKACALDPRSVEALSWLVQNAGRARAGFYVRLGQGRHCACGTPCWTSVGNIVAESHCALREGPPASGSGAVHGGNRGL